MLFSLSRIYPPEHFQAKYGVDEVHYADEVLLILRFAVYSFVNSLSCIRLYLSIYLYINFKCSYVLLDDRRVISACRNLFLKFHDFNFEMPGQ